jgi:uncharacterized membrane protein YfcA
MTIIQIIILLITGAVAGFAGGLMGVGGGFIMAPVQYFVYTAMGVSPDIAIKMAFGTNLLVILPTALSATWGHHRNKTVRWRSAIIMGCCSMIGGFIGSTIANYLPGQALKIIFSVLVILSAVRMIIATPVQIEGQPRENTWLLIAWAFPIGIVTGMLGIGGGIIVVPVMTLALKFSWRNAVATSMAMMIFTSLGGVIGYIINGWDAVGVPAPSLGYVNLQSWFLLVVTSIVFAQLGAIASRHIPIKPVRYIFIALMLYTSLKMLGVFTLLGLPL